MEATISCVCEMANGQYRLDLVCFIFMLIVIMGDIEKEGPKNVKLRTDI